MLPGYPGVELYHHQSSSSDHQLKRKLAPLLSRRACAIGSAPVNPEFPHNTSSSMCSSFASEVGTGPSSLLDQSCKLRNSWHCPMEDGMVPRKPFMCKNIVRTWLNCPRDGGKIPGDTTGGSDKGQEGVSTRAREHVKERAGVAEAGAAQRHAPPS